MLADMMITLRASTVLFVLFAATSQVTADDAKNLTKAEIARLGKLATALVESERGSFGSAFCVHQSGLYITNSHVIQDATSEVSLVLNGGESDESRLRAKVVRRDKELDLCLLRVERAEKLPALTLGNVKGLHELAELVTFGYPFGRGLAAQRGQYPPVSVNLASVTSLQKRGGDLSRIQLDASVNPGNSGGPVLDLTGKVVGMIVGRVEAAYGAGVDLAIPVSYVRRFLSRPDIEFRAPQECAADEHVEFQASAISVLPTASPIVLELVLLSGAFEERRYPMTQTGESYRVEAIPFPDTERPVRVGLKVIYEDGSVSGSVDDQSFRIGTESVSLSQVRVLRLGGNAEAELNERRTIRGALSDLATLPLDVGGQSLQLNLADATQVIVESANVGTAASCMVVARVEGEEVGRKSLPIYLKGIPRASMDAVREGKFIKPQSSAVPVTYLRAISTPGDYIGQGKQYSYEGNDLNVQRTNRGVLISVDGWRIEFGGPGQQFLEVGEYTNAKRHAFSKDSPGIAFGKGRGCNQISGEFVVWEIEMKGNEVASLAIDFVQRCEEKMPPLYGMIRYRSSYH